jgi:fucose permease
MMQLISHYRLAWTNAIRLKTGIPRKFSLLFRPEVSLLGSIGNLTDTENHFHTIDRLISPGNSKMQNAHSPARLRFMTYACFAITLVAGISGTLLGPAFQSLALRFTIPLESSGIFTGLQFTGITLSIFATGRLLDRYDARYALMSGSILTGVGLLMIAGAQALPMALLGAFVLGLGYGIADVAANVVIAKINPEHTGAALSLLAFFYGLGAVLGPQIVNWALMHQNFTLAFTVTAVASLLLTIPFSQSSLPAYQAGQGTGAANTNQINWWTLLPFAVFLFVYVGIEVGFSSWIVTQISTLTKASESLATVGASLFWIGVTIARGTASIALHRFTERQILTISILAVIAGTLLLLVLPSFEVVALISAFCVGLGCGPLFPISLTLAGNVYPEARGKTSGTMIAAGTLGGAILPWIQGRLGGGHSGGMEAILFLAIVLLIIERLKLNRLLSGDCLPQSIV